MIVPLKDKTPIIDDSAFVFENAVIIGDVNLAENVNVWPSAVLRGDLNNISVGMYTNVQDNATVHTQPAAPTIIGCGVTIGHNAIIHGCHIEDNVLIGMGAIILDNAYIERDVIIAAGALIPQGKRIPTGSLVMGSPGKIVRMLTAEEINSIRKNASEYAALAELYKN